MKHVLLMLIIVFALSSISLQAQVYSEDFEGTPTMSSSGTTGAVPWAINSRIFSQGIKSDSASVTQGDTTYLTTNTSFSTVGKYAVYLDFDQICKISLFDSAYIEVSNNNGTTWQKARGTHYLGTALYASQGDRFTELSYGLQWGSINLVAPEQSWWKHEKFDISSLAGNSANVKIRFVLIDADNDGAGGRNGWFLDDIVVTSSVSELVPPTISLIYPGMDTTMSQSSPYQITARITDASGIDTAYIAYSANGGIIDTVPMMATAVADSFVGSIPFVGFGRTVQYQIYAKDASFANNLGVGPTNGTYKINSVYVPGMDTPTYTEGFELGIPSTWTQETNDLMDWSPNSGTANSSLTGPDAAHEGTHYMYIEATSNFNKNAIITTNTYDLSSISNAMMTFRYHMYGAQMGDLKIHLFSNGSWTNDVLIISGQQQTAETDPWLEATIDLAMYQTSDFKFRIEGVTLGAYTSDISVDDFKIGPAVTLATDAGISEITSPTIGTINNVAFDVKVKLSNFGNDTLVTTNINWTLDGNAQDTTAYSGQLLSGNDSIVNLGPLTLAGGSYTISSWTDIPNGTYDQNLLNDTASYSFFVCNSVLSGTYTIDPAGSGVTNFASFSDVQLALMQCGINGPVIFNVAAGTYNENISLSSIGGSSATNTIIFQSAGGDSSTVTLAYNATDETDNYVVNLDGTSNVTFKDMTIQALDSTFARVFVIGNNSENLAFNNNIIKTPRTSVDDDRMALIFGTAYYGNNLNISNNMMVGANYSVILAADSVGENWTINNNIFDQTHASAIALTRAKSVQIMNNTIIGDTAGCAPAFQGIGLVENTGTATITKNNILTTSSNVVYGIRLSSCNFDSIVHTTIVNNIIQLDANSATTSLSAGIINQESKNVDIYYNTVRMSGFQENSTAITLLDATAGASMYINIVNNIFTNNASGYIYYVSNVDTSLWNDHHNVLYNYELGSNYSYLGGNIATFDDWIIASGTYNTYSIDPYFISDTDLHVSNNLLNAFATPIAGITTDIDGDTRDLVSPDNGADEFTPSPFDIITIEILTPMSDCGLSNAETVTVRYRNIGTSDITTFNAYYQITGSATIVNEVVTTVIPAGDTLDYSFTATVDFDVNTFGADSTFGIQAWAVLTGDVVQVNDSTFTEINSGFVPGAPIVFGDTINYGQTATIDALGLNPYFWATSTATDYLMNDTVYTTPNLYDTTEYWVSDRAGAGLDTILIGTGTTTGKALPLEPFYGYSYSQTIYKASYFGNEAGVISEIQYQYSGTAGFGPDAIKVYIGTTSNNLFAATNSWLPISDFTMVYDATMTAPAGGGWVKIIFTEPFDYNGIDNLVIGFEENTPGYHSSTDDFACTIDPNGDKVSIRYYSDGTNPDPASPPTGVIQDYYPNTKFTFNQSGCYGPRIPITIVVENIPSIDASISTITSPMDTVLGNTDLDVIVEIENYGTSTLTSLDIIYSLNDVIVDTIAWTGSIAYQSTQTVTIDTINVLGGLFDLKAWSHNPNGFADTINSNDTAYIVFAAQLNGNYTIGASATHDYPDFTTAIDALVEGGVGGPCIFDIDSGTYTAQVVIPEIYGMSAINNVIFQSMSGDSTLSILDNYSTAYDYNYVIKLDGADYFTFQNLTMKASGSTNYNGVIEIANESSHNNFYNNLIQSAVTTSTYGRCIYSSSDNDNYTNIINNHIKDGYYGIYMSGAGSAVTNNEEGVVIKDNFIDGFHYYGIYTRYQDSVIIRNNKLVDAAANTGGYGMYIYYCNEGMDVSNNILELSPSSSIRGMYIYYSAGNATERGLVSNNMISISSGTGINYGLHLYQAQFLDVYHNSVNITGTSTTSRAMHIYESNAAYDVNIANNILSDSTGYSMYIQNMVGVNSLDYNSHYTTSANMAYNGSNKADLAALQASSNIESHSVFGDPMYTSNTDLHLLSTNLSGLAISTSLVPEDIDGKLRNLQAPTIGAHEVDLLPLDMATQEILLVPNNTGEFTSYPVMAVIRNNGTDTIFGYQVNYTINAGTPVVNAFIDTLAPYTIDTVSLTPFISPAGNSILCVTGVATGDGNMYNNEVCHNFFGTPQKDAYVVAVNSIDGGCSLSTDTVTMWIKNIGTDTMNGPSQTGTITVSFKNDNEAAATVTTENFITQVNPGDSVSYEFAGLVDLSNYTQVDSTYTVTTWVTYPGDNVNYNDTASTDVYSVHVPMDPIFTTPITIEFATAPLISATATDSIYWYDYDTSSVEFYMGSKFQSDLMFATDTFYLQASTGGGVFKITETVQFKTGTGYTNPYPSYLPTGDFDGVEISNLGMSPGDLAGYQINVSVGTNLYNYTFPPNSNIDGGDVALAIYGSSLTIGPAGNNVFNINSSTSISSASVVAYWLVSPEGDVVDAFSAFNASFPTASGVTAADFTGSFPTGSGKAGAVRVVSDTDDASDWLLTDATTSSFGAFNTILPQEGGSGCTSNRMPLVVNVNAQQANDLHTSAIIEPVSLLNLTSDEDVTLRIINFGTATQSNFDIAYQLNNNTPVTATVFTSLLSMDTALYTFAQGVDLSTVDSTYMLKAYTDLTNDQNRLNDTVMASVTNLLPNYCISQSNSGLYMDLTTVSMGTWSHTYNTASQMYNDFTNETPSYIYASQSYNMTIGTSTTSPYASYTKVYIDYNRDGDFDDAGEMVLESAFTPPALVTGMIAIPHYAVLGPTRMRVIVDRYGSTSATQACGTYSYGETRDYTVYVMDPIPNDAGVETFVGLSNLTAASSLPITTRIRNYGTDPINSVDIKYYNGSGSVNSYTYNAAPIAPGDSVDVLVGNLMIADGMNEICAYTVLANDSNTFNDSLCYNVFREAVVNLSYCDDFEGTDLWMPDTLLNQWERGIPAMTNITSAHSPVNVWAIDLDGTYENNNSQLLYSPRFVIGNTVDSAMLKFWHYYDNQTGSDGGYIQYSKNSGAWISLGYVSDTRATNWYNNATGGTNKFSGTSPGWIESTYNFDFTSGEFDNTDTIQIRFNFYSNASVNTGDGWAIDDLCFELPLQPNDVGVVAVTDPVNTAQIGSPVNVTVDITNFGSATQTSIDVWYQIDSDPIVTETFTPTGGLAYLDTVSYTFTTPAVAPFTNFVVCSGTDLASDAYPQNDDKCSDVIGVTAAAIDGGVTAIGKIQAYGGQDTTSILSPVVLTAEVKNFGVNTLTSFDVEYSLDNGTTWYTETWNGSLATDDVDTYVFATTYNSPIGNYGICVRTVITNDAFAGNDMICPSLIGSGINDANGIIFEVAQSEPNPAVGNVRINYIVPTNGDINFELRNTLGQVIYSTEQASFTGKNTIEVDADKLANGVYYYSVVFDGQRITRKMIVNQ